MYGRQKSAVDSKDLHDYDKFIELFRLKLFLEEGLGYGQKLGCKQNIGSRQLLFYSFRMF